MIGTGDSRKAGDRFWMAKHKEIQRGYKKG